MKKNWQDCKNILIIRLDNMGDLLMSAPAIHAVKKSLGCSITVLTSSMAAGIVPYVKDIDDMIVSDVPWVKSDKNAGAGEWNRLLHEISRRQFDGAIIFSVFSQNPMPAILLTWLAGIPNRLAYCRENPYHLLTDWVPEKEPYSFVRHQVQRDIDLVASIGATAKNSLLSLKVPNHAYSRINAKLIEGGIDPSGQWIIIHPGASERKREYPVDRFKTIIQQVISELGIQVILTGTAKEKTLTDQLHEHVGNNKCKSMAGKFSLEEFMALIDIAPLVLSVNTGTVHIASALNTPLIVLYAKTNPQHTPWRVPHELFMFPVEEELQSKNEVLKFVQDNIMGECTMPDPGEVVQAIRRMLRTNVVRPA